MTGKNTCMGIFQFGGEIERTFDEIVKPLVQTHTGLVYQDARYYYESSSIKMDLISRMIEESNLVIADLSVKNPNVFLELGIAYNLRKPLILLCSKRAFRRMKKWVPFDLQGRELLIFDGENDLKVQLGKLISDSLYSTKAVTLSWISNCKDNYGESDIIEIFKDGAIWSTNGLNSYFIISFHVKIHEEYLSNGKNPDVRMYISSAQNGCPHILLIFPWELSEKDPKMLECHIDYFLNPEMHVDIEKHRLVQVSVAKRNIDLIREFDVFISFCWPNLVFEAPFFEEKIHRLSYPIEGFRMKGYPVHLSQFIGFSSVNRVSISNIKIKEIFRK